MASGIVSGTSTSRLSPLRSKIGDGATWVMTYRSPAGPPLRPASPLPASRTRLPSRTPAGMLTLYCLTVRVAPAALAGRARVLDDGAGAAAPRARLRDREQALALGLDAPAVAPRADLRAGARLGARAAAGRTGLRRRDRERDLGALDRLVERDRDLGLEVAPALGRGARARRRRPGGAARGAAEEVGEMSPKPPASKPPGKPLGAAGLAAAEERAEPAAVVLLALLGIAEDVVGRRDLLERSSAAASPGL